jgi:hypothetical protein
MKSQQMQVKFREDSCCTIGCLAFNNRVAQPEAAVYNELEWIGDPTGELATAAKADASMGGNTLWDIPAFCQPVIEPEEFESVYAWFLS